jgi:putative serine protease PepD
MQVQPISSELAQSTGGAAGLWVQSVTAGGPAAEAGLRPGDVITEVEGEPVQGIDSLVVKTLSMNAGDTIQLTFERQGASHTATLTLGQGG